MVGLTEKLGGTGFSIKPTQPTVLQTRTTKAGGEELTGSSLEPLRF